MSTIMATVAAAVPTTQPFQCTICQSRFTRHENLKRHAALHSRDRDEASFPCEYCQVTFSRRDLRLRHVKRKHPEQDEARSTKRIRHGPASASRWSDGESSQGDEGEVASLSTTNSHNILSTARPGDEDGNDTGVQAWQMNIPQGQQMEHDYQYYARGSIDSSMRSVPTAEEEVLRILASQLSHQEVSSGPNYVGESTHDAASLQQRMLMGRSNLEPFQSPGNETQSAADFSPGSVAIRSECSSLHIPDGLSLKDLPYIREGWFPSAAQTARGYQLYFNHVSHFVPFLHRPTFDATEVSHHLGMSMLSLGYQYGEDPDHGYEAGSGHELSLRCFHQARVLAISEEEKADDLSHNINLIQSYWLLQVCAIMYLCGKESAYGLKLHSRMISLARFGGLTKSAAVKLESTLDLESLWRESIKAESHKRTLLAVHQIDALWYQFFSIPRSLSHLEIKSDLPFPGQYWTASSAAQWAHRLLVAGKASSMLPYAEAVRRFLSPDPEVETLPEFDPYGAINIAQFLLSSAREVSGWSTMTGRVSLERFEPLRLSLVALERFIRPANDTQKSTHGLMCEATWEMAMIELQMWSPSHICGIVEGSVDAVLRQTTYLASTASTELFNLDNAKDFQLHVNWFLRYLENTLVPDSEPPWLALYAYKAFLIAWQLLRAMIPGAMDVVGVPDGDTKMAMEWAVKVFERRRRLQLGRLILLYLAELDR